MLAWEVVVVMTVGFLPAIVEAITLLGRSLALHTTSNPNEIRIPGHPGLDIGLGILGFAAASAPIALVGYLLSRSSESLRGIGLNLTRFRRDLGLGGALAVGTFAASIAVGILAGSVLGVHSSNRLPSDMRGWYLLEFLVASGWTALLEEVLVCGYLLHRLRQLGWSDRRSLAASSAIRASYHVYGGLPLVLLTIPLGLVFGRIYQRSQRLTALVLAHFLYDATLFAIFALTR